MEERIRPLFIVDESQCELLRRGHDEGGGVVGGEVILEIVAGDDDTSARQIEGHGGGDFSWRSSGGGRDEQAASGDWFTIYEQSDHHRGFFGICSDHPQENQNAGRVFVIAPGGEIGDAEVSG